MTAVSSTPAGSERHRRALLSTLTATGFGYLMMLVSFVTVPFYLKWLGVKDYGQFLTLLAFMGYLNFADAGLNWGALVLIGQSHGRGDKSEVARLFRHATALAYLSAFLATLLTAGFYVLSRTGHPLPMFAKGPSPGASLLLIGIKSALMLSMSSVMAMAYGLQEGYVFSRLQGYFQLLGTTLMLGAAYWWRNVESVVAASTLASAVATIVTVAFGRRRYAEYLALPAPFSTRTFILLFRTGAKGFLLQGSRLVRTTLPVFMIAAYLGSASVPSFTLPMTLLGVITAFLFNWSASLQTAYGEAWAKGDKEWILRSLDHLVVRGFGWIVFAACFILGLGQWFIRIWTGGHVLVPAAMLGSAVAAAVASWGTDLFIFALVGINRQRRIAFVEIANVGIGAGLGWMLCTSGHATYIGFGIFGSALVTTLFFGWRELKFWLGRDAVLPDRPSITRLTLVSGFTFGVLVVARNLWAPSPSPITNWMRMSAVGLIGAGVFLAGIALSGLSSDRWPGFGWGALGQKWKLGRATPEIS